MMEQEKVVGAFLPVEGLIRARKGKVTADNADGTVEVQLGASTSSSTAHHLAGYSPSVNDVVLVLVDGLGGATVVGAYAS